MISNWDILIKELAYNDICVINGVLTLHKKRITLPNLIKKVKTSIKKEKNIYLKYWNSSLKVLEKDFEGQHTVNDFVADRLKKRIFICALKNMSRLENTLFSTNNLYKFLKKDIKSFKEITIDKFIEHTASLMVIFRSISKKYYLIDLLMFYSLGENKINNKNYVKTASGVMGPWSRLDLPMKERVWRWNEIEEDMSGRRKDIQRQHRYRNGFLNYRNRGVGEGHYWRELRNEPYLWANRFSESPYAQLKPETWR